MAEFQLDLRLSLRRTTIIIIAEILWKSQDVKKKINELMQQNKLKLLENKFRLDEFNWLARQLSDDNYYCWEEVISSVLKKTNSLLLPPGVETDLREIIILMGEKIFYFYDEYEEAGEAWEIFYKHVRCHKCMEAAKTEHFYSFSNVGTTVYNCTTLHLKNVPGKDPEIFKEFLYDICHHCNLKLIEKYENDIIVYLESIQPGLNLKSKKDIIFNIICVWNFIQYNLPWKRIIRVEPNKNGFLIVPNHYLNNADFIIPLEVVPQITIGACPPTLKYLATKLREYDDQSLLFSKIMQFQINYEHGLKINKRLHFHPDPDYKPNRMLLMLKLMSANEKANFIQTNLKTLLICFLPVWPFQEIVPHILDVCIEKNFDLDNHFLLVIISICIGNQNRNQHKVQKQTYLQAFKKIWHKTSKETKLTFLTRKTGFLLLQNSDCHIVKKLLFNIEHIEEIPSVIMNKWKEIFEKKDFVLVNKFISEAVFNGELLIHELEHFLNDYSVEYMHRAVACRDNFIL